MSTDAEKKYIGAIPQADLDAHNAKYKGRVRVLEVEDADHPNHVHCAYLRPLGLSEIDRVLGLAADNRRMTAGQEILRLCWLAGSTRLNTPDEYDEVYITGCLTAFKGIELKIGELKKTSASA